jgi:hypothetical protein
MFVYVVVARPFKNRALNIVNISTELFIALSYSTVISFYFDLSDEQENAIKWCVISFVICSLSVTVGYILLNFGLVIKRLVIYFRRRKDVKPEVKQEVRQEVHSLAPRNVDVKLQHEDDILFNERSNRKQLNMTQDSSYNL